MMELQIYKYWKNNICAVINEYLISVSAALQNVPDIKEACNAFATRDF